MSRQPRMTGRPSRFRGKLRHRPLQITLTPEGHAALAVCKQHSGDSNSDEIERLLRQRAAQLARITTT